MNEKTVLIISENSMIIEKQTLMVLSRPSLTGLIYPEEVVNDAIKELPEEIFGMVGFSSESNIFWKDIAFKVENIKILNKKVVGDVRFLDTPNGIKAKELYKSGDYWFSLSGNGKLNNRTIEEYHIHYVSIRMKDDIIQEYEKERLGMV